MPKVSVAEAKSHLSELIAKSAHSQERFIITRRDKPVAALVSLDDLRIIEQHRQVEGLAAIAGKWKGFDELAEALGEIEALRQGGGGGRDVSF
jgi:prevent-host-death family protein